METNGCLKEKWKCTQLLNNCVACIWKWSAEVYSILYITCSLQQSFKGPSECVCSFLLPHFSGELACFDKVYLRWRIPDTSTRCFSGALVSRLSDQRGFARWCQQVGLTVNFKSVLCWTKRQTTLSVLLSLEAVYFEFEQVSAVLIWHFIPMFSWKFKFGIKSDCPNPDLESVLAGETLRQALYRPPAFY